MDKVVGEEKGRAQFCWSEPVFYDEQLIESELVPSVTARQKELKLNAGMCQDNLELRTLTFPMNTLECQPTFGPACPYKTACWNASVRKDPIGSGIYMERTPHHELEVIGVE